MEEEMQELTPQVVLPLTHRGYRMHIPAYIHIKNGVRRGGSDGVLKGERRKREDVKRQPSFSDDQHI